MSQCSWPLRPKDRPRTPTIRVSSPHLMGPFLASPPGWRETTGPKAGDAGGSRDAGVKPSLPGSTMWNLEAQPLAWPLGLVVPPLWVAGALNKATPGPTLSWVIVGPLTGHVAGGQLWADEEPGGL